MRVYPANQAQIIRSFQRDDDAIRTLQYSMKEALGVFMSNSALASRFVNITVSFLTKLGYYGCTTLSGNQTLGEEYVGAVISHRNLTFPSKLKLLWIVMFRVWGSDTLSYLLSAWEKAERRRERRGKSTSYSAAERGKFILILNEMSSLLSQLRKGIFYMTGHLYDVGMFTVGVHYILVRAWMQDERLSQYFKIIGFLTLLHFVFNAAEKWKKLQRLEYEEKEYYVGEADSKTRCHLCLERRKHTSATPCGHLFCWACIIEAVSARNECPVCREKLIPSRVVRLQNCD